MCFRLGGIWLKSKINWPDWPAINYLFVRLSLVTVILNAPAGVAVSIFHMQLLVFCSGQEIKPVNSTSLFVVGVRVKVISAL